MIKMDCLSIIRKKRDGLGLSADEIEFMVSSFTRGEIPSYQFASFLMASFLNGLDKDETSWLTRSMLFSGEVLDLSSIPGAKIDKHSTGGIGDKTSLILAPVLASLGVKVPMISGRGLGHTGGTLDKLEAIPGFNTRLSLVEFKKNLAQAGFQIIGQTEEIAPADGKIYRLRDATETVESIPLITASIMSKKLAEGIDGLVLDVKTGNGAFMKSEENAIALAESLVEVAGSFGKRVSALVTDMNEPLGQYIGNWLEVLESIKLLKGDYIPGLSELSIALAGEMLFIAGRAESPDEGAEMASFEIKSGRAFDKFLEGSVLQGADGSFLLNPEKYKKSSYSAFVKAGSEGYVKSIDARALGLISRDLGAGRHRMDEAIDPKAGIRFMARIGEHYKNGDILAEIFTDKKEVVEDALQAIEHSIVFSKEQVQKPALIKKILRKD